LIPYSSEHLTTNTTDVIATPAPPTAGPDARPEVVVQLDDVTVIYGPNRALKGVSARFAKGAVGLLGPNGAGKSTMLKSLLGFIKPAEGHMSVLGLDVAKHPLEIRARLGYMPESDAHIPGMNAVTFVGYCGQLAGLPAVDAMQRAHEVLYYVGLGEARYRNIETYSTGMKQRIKLAQALVHDPDLLFLDEPTNGMDPKGRDEMLELIRDLGHNKNVNLILSSHLLPDVEYTCDYVVVMDKGNVVAQGPIAELKGPSGRVFELRIKGDLPGFINMLRASGIKCHATDEDVMRVFVPAGFAEAHSLATDQQVLFMLAAKFGVQVRHLRPSVPTLEDVFAKAVGEKLDDLGDESHDGGVVDDHKDE
jgi:ABC-2 type transport system ATP-binding protein